jgi:hypothetical protein
MIGIRQADGSFYEILGDAQAGRKRLVLSAARRDQRGVKIDLYRSVNGSLDGADSLGTIVLDDPAGLGFQDIEFHVDLGADDLLSASAALPGQAPRTLSVDLSAFHTSRSDQDILGDETLVDTDFDTLDDSFAEPMTLDLPDNEPEAPRRSDADILGDESFDTVELDTLEDFSFGDEPSETDALSGESMDEPPSESSSALAEESFGLPDLDLSPSDFDEPPMAGEPASDDLDLPSENFDTPAVDSFDLGDLDAGFGTELEPQVEEDSAAANPAEDWEKVSFDDMEAMEFLDTGDEISAPAVKEAPAPGKVKEEDPFSMDHDDPLDLGDYDADLSGLSELPDLDGDLPGPSSASPADSNDEFDQDFLPPAALTESDSWEDEAAAAPPAKASKAPKPAKASSASAPGPRSREPGGLDKTALVLSLATLSLLLLLIVVLLFLNLIRAPQAPVVQPEVMRWKPTAQASAPKAPSGAAEVDLAAADPEVFEAASVLEVPAGLRGARVALTLVPGDTPADAARRFGEPARRQGNQLFW